MDPIPAGYPYVLRSTVQQTTEGLIWTPPSLDMRFGPDLGYTRINRGAEIRRFELHNRSGGAASVGIGFRYANKIWRAFSHTGAGVHTETTAAAQNVVADDVVLQIINDNNSGFVICSLVPFDWVSINVTTAGVDGAVTADNVPRYSNWAGTGWTALDTASMYTDQFTVTNGVYAAGELNFVWKRPVNWGKNLSIASLPVGYYCLEVRATDAPDTTAALAGSIEIGSLAMVTESLGDNGIYSGGGDSADGPWWCNEADGVVAYFSTANAGNGVWAECGARG